MEGLIVGQILNTHGLKGELKIKVVSDFERFFKGSKLFIEYKNDYLPVEVLSAKEYDNSILVTFKDLCDINLVEKYKGSYVYIDKANLEKLDSDSFYMFELINLPVYNQNGVLRGNVLEVREVPQGHLLVLKIDGKNKFIPFRKEFVTSATKEKIVINEIEGLL